MNKHLLWCALIAGAAILVAVLLDASAALIVALLCPLSMMFMMGGNHGKK